MLENRKIAPAVALAGSLLLLGVPGASPAADQPGPQTGRSEAAAEAADPAAAGRADPAAALEGRRLYLANCSACHGQGGHGNGPIARHLSTKPRDHTDDAWMSQHSDEALLESMRGGGEAFHGSRYMPGWELKLSEHDLRSLVAFMRYLHRSKPWVAPREGKPVYERYCRNCHGETGRGDGPLSQAVGKAGPVPLDFTNRLLMLTRSNADLYFSIYGGSASAGKESFMPAWAGALTDEEIWRVVAYIRSFSSKE